MAATISMDDRRGFANRVGRKFDKFWQWKLPCPVDPTSQIYRQAFTDKEWGAMRYLLQEKPGTIRRADSFNLFWTDDVSATSSCPHVTFRFSKKVKLPDFPIKLDELPQEVQYHVRNWIIDVNRFRVLRDELIKRCKGIMGNPTGEGNAWHSRRRKDLDPCVNTPNQLYRIWPEIQPLMPREWKRTVQLASVKSRLPQYVSYRMHRDGQNRFVTPEEFRCEDALATDYEKRSFREINDIITMVSLAGDVPNVDNYPHFSGDLSTV